MKNYIANSPRELLMPWSVFIKDEMLAVEECLREAINSNNPVAFELSQHLLNAGGKRLRPALVILSAKAAGCLEMYRATTVAACCEMVHMASLVHDDVIDSTCSRRGRDTANTLWGNKVSVLSGDHLVSKAFATLIHDGDLRLLRELSSMTIVMSESEILQATSQGNLSAWEEHYWEIVQGKTAAFMETCCKLGAILSGADEEVISALGSFGANIGVAFQVIDDLLDIAGDPALTGKPFGTDLKEGKTTLPILIAMKDSDDAVRVTLLSLLNASDITAREIDAISACVCASGAIEKTRKIAYDYAVKGVDALRKLPQSDARDNLETLAYQLIDRIH